MAKTTTQPTANRKPNLATHSQNVEMPQPVLNQFIKDEVSRISEIYAIDAEILQEFALFVVNNHKKKEQKAKVQKIAKPKALSLTQLKEAIYKYFDVKDTNALKRSGSFKMATDGMGNLNLGSKETWERLYREFIGVLPGEENQQGYGCINGTNIFNYFKPWQVFGLDPQTATPEDIKKAYRELSKVYHPDVPGSGDAQVFDRINTMYKSITTEV